VPEFAGWSVAVFLFWLFGSAAVHKVRNPLWYAGLLRGWFPSLAGVSLIARAAGFAEAAVALMLLMPTTRALGLIAAALMLVAYAVAMGLVMLDGSKQQKCGCGGSSSDLMISGGLVIRNGVCAGLALLAAMPSVVTDAHPMLKVGMAVLIGTFMALTYSVIDVLMSNKQAMAGVR